MVSDLLRKNSSGKISFTEFIIGVCAVFVVIVLAAPMISGYNLNADEVSDDGNSVVIQNYIMELEEEGNIQINDNLDVVKLNEQLKKVVYKIPECKKTGDNFYLNKKTGKVLCKNNKTEDEILIKY